MLSPVRSVGGDMVWRQTTVVASTPPGQHYTTLNHRRTDLRVTVHKALGWCVESKKLVRLNAFPAATRCHCQEPCLTHDTHTEHRRTTGRYAVDCVAHPCWLQTGRNRIGPDVPTVRQNRPSCRRRWSCCRCHRCPTASSSACGALPCRLPTPPHCCQPPTKPALCTHTHLRFFATDALNVSKLDSLRGLSPPPETFSECRPLTPGTREPSPTEAALWRRRFSLRWCRTRRLVDRFEAVGAACKLCGKAEAAVCQRGGGVCVARVGSQRRT